jgi:hypothetical protein
MLPFRATVLTENFERGKERRQRRARAPSSPQCARIRVPGPTSRLCDDRDLPRRFRPLGSSGWPQSPLHPLCETGGAPPPTAVSSGTRTGGPEGWVDTVDRHIPRTYRAERAHMNTDIVMSAITL